MSEGREHTWDRLTNIYIYIYIEIYIYIYIYMLLSLSISPISISSIPFHRGLVYR